MFTCSGAKPRTSVLNVKPNGYYTFTVAYRQSHSRGDDKVVDMRPAVKFLDRLRVNVDQRMNRAAVAPHLQEI